MLTSLAISNFKCFSDLRMGLSPLTLLTGFNGGGKSTSIQPLLLLSQAVRRNRNPVGLPLNGPLARLGTVGDVVFADGSPVFAIDSARDKIRWQFAAEAGQRLFIISEAVAHGPFNQEARWTESVWPRLPAVYRRDQVRQSLNTLSYLTALRAGTPEVYPIPEADDELRGDVGCDGRFAAYWYDKSVDDKVDSWRLEPSEKATTFRKQIDAYRSLLFPGAQANVTAIPQASALALRFRIGGSSEWRRPANIGFGLSYAFPILVSLLTVPTRGCVVIDSPEAHLHPSAQSEMGRILARMATAGIQIIVETHSDHLLNGVRLAVKRGIILHDKVSIHFFGGVSGETHGVTSPAIDAEGTISEWPSGFFDQTEKDLASLSGWD
jgi:predicted ATPase